MGLYNNCTGNTWSSEQEDQHVAIDIYFGIVGGRSIICRLQLGGGGRGIWVDLHTLLVHHTNKDIRILVPLQARELVGGPGWATSQIPNNFYAHTPTITV